MYTSPLNSSHYLAYDLLLKANGAPEPVESCQIPASEIMARLFLGNIYDAHYLYERQDISKPIYVLNIAATHPFLVHAYPGIRYLNIRDVHDGPNSIAPYFIPAIRFIEQALANPHAVILVHCLAGMVRSATLIVAYMIYKDFMDRTLNANVQQHDDASNDLYAAALGAYNDHLSISKDDERISSFVNDKIRQIKEKRAIVAIRSNFIGELKAFTKLLLNLDPHLSPAMLDYHLLLTRFHDPRFRWQEFSANSNCVVM